MGPPAQALEGDEGLRAPVEELPQGLVAPAEVGFAGRLQGSLEGPLGALGRKQELPRLEHELAVVDGVADLHSQHGCAVEALPGEHELPAGELCDHIYAAGEVELLAGEAGGLVEVAELQGQLGSVPSPGGRTRAELAKTIEVAERGPRADVRVVDGGEGLGDLHPCVAAGSGADPGQAEEKQSRGEAWSTVRGHRPHAMRKPVVWRRPWAGREVGPDSIGAQSVLNL